MMEKDKTISIVISKDSSIYLKSDIPVEIGINYSDEQVYNYPNLIDRNWHLYYPDGPAITS